MENKEAILSYFNEKMTNLPSSSKTFQLIGVGYSLNVIYMNFDFICSTLYYTLYGAALTTGAFGIGYVSTVTLYKASEICKSLFNDEDDDEEVSPIDEFLMKEYDVFESIYEEGQSKIQEYENMDSVYIESLKNEANHFTSDLPFEYNNKLIMYYDAKDEGFHYFTKSCDIQYKILNSVCRSYVLENKCLNLFTDTLDLKEVGAIEEDQDEAEAEAEDQDEDYQEVSKDTCEEEENTMMNSLFYRKKSKVDKEKEKPKETKSINKFMYKGNLQEYEKVFHSHVNKETKEIDYQTYKEQNESSI